MSTLDCSAWVPPFARLSNETMSLPDWRLTTIDLTFAADHKPLTPTIEIEPLTCRKTRLSAASVPLTVSTPWELSATTGLFDQLSATPSSWAVPLGAIVTLCPKPPKTISCPAAVRMRVAPEPESISNALRMAWLPVDETGLGGWRLCREARGVVAAVVWLGLGDRPKARRADRFSNSS